MRQFLTASAYGQQKKEDFRRSISLKSFFFTMMPYEHLEFDPYALDHGNSNETF